MTADKKVKEGKIHFVILSSIGKTKITNSISKEKIIEVLMKL